jgi:transposase
MYKLDAWDPYSQYVPREAAMSNLTYIGIDIGKEVNCCSLPKRKPFMFPNDKTGIRKMLRQAKTIDSPGRLCFVMESTSVYSSRTAEAILEIADTWTAIVPPACVNGFKLAGLVRTKNDFVDASAIREFAEAKKPTPWLPPTEAQRRLRNLQVVMDNLVKAAARMKNVREKLVNEHRPDSCALASCTRMIGQVEDELDALQVEIDRVISADEVLAADSAHILSIPGIGPRVRNVMMSVIYEQLRNLPQRKLLTYCGMSPKDHISGKHRGRTLMSKAGDARVRGVLYMAALVSIRKGALMHDYYQKQKQAGKPSKVAIVNVMRRLLYLIQGVIKSNAPFDREVFLARC